MEVLVLLDFDDSVDVDAVVVVLAAFVVVCDGFAMGVVLPDVLLAEMLLKEILLTETLPTMVPLAVVLGGKETDNIIVVPLVTTASTARFVVGRTKGAEFVLLLSVVDLVLLWVVLPLEGIGTIVADVSLAVFAVVAVEGTITLVV